MKRLLLLLPICLCFAPQNATEALDVPDGTPVVMLGSNEKPTPEQFSQLVRKDIVAALAAGIRRYRAEVRDYTCLMKKQERIKGRLRKPEVVFCAYREKPFSVLMEWKAGDSKAAASLFVEGENGDEILVAPSGRFEMMALKAVGKHYVSRAVSHPEVREASRYTVHEFGLSRGMERTYTAWKAAQQAGALHVEYLGEKPILELDGRVCHVIHRTVDPPEEDGLSDLTLYIDRENWLQTGSVLKEGDQLIGTYYFADLRINPTLPAERFKPDVLKR